MLHSHANRSAKTLVAVVLVPFLSGCLGDGLPWGQLETSMTASFAPPGGRLDDQGRLKTTANYVVDDLKVTVGFDAFSLVLAAQGAAGFDPANPPEGYSLCHNGHCHSDSGALVDYEDIALEMAGGSGGVDCILFGLIWWLKGEKARQSCLARRPAQCIASASLTKSGLTISVPE